MMMTYARSPSKFDNQSALQAAAIVPESVLMIGDRLKMNKYSNVDQQTPGVITPYTINTETGALGQELTKNNYCPAPHR